VPRQTAHTATQLGPFACREYDWEYVERVSKYRETDGVGVFARVSAPCASSAAGSLSSKLQQLQQQGYVQLLYETWH
jgi:hypothetical protein